MIERTRDIAKTFTDGRASIDGIVDETKAKIGNDLSSLSEFVGSLLSTNAAAFADKLAENREAFGCDAVGRDRPRRFDH